MKAFSPAQLALILSLVESEKYDILADIEAENFVDGKKYGLSKASISILERRFWELAAIEEILISNQTTPTTAN